MAVETEAPSGEQQQLDLVATTVHELKTPLTLINGTAAMLESGDFGKLAPQQRQQIRRIAQTSERLLAVVESLLSISKFKAGILPAENTPVAVNRVIEGVIAELEPKTRQQKLEIVFQRRRRTPPAIADYDFLWLVLFNLVDNAIKYAPPNSRIMIKTRAIGDELQVLVSDEGEGISPGDFERIFTRHGQAKSGVAAKSNSSGLGLYIAKELMEAIGGSLKVKTTTKGTCFTASLPITDQLGLFGEGTAV